MVPTVDALVLGLWALVITVLVTLLVLAKGRCGCWCHIMAVLL